MLQRLKKKQLSKILTDIAWIIHVIETFKLIASCNLVPRIEMIQNIPEKLEKTSY